MGELHAAAPYDHRRRVSSSIREAAAECAPPVEVLGNAVLHDANPLEDVRSLFLLVASRNDQDGQTAILDLLASLRRIKSVKMLDDRCSSQKEIADVASSAEAGHHREERLECVNSVIAPQSAIVALYVH